MNGDFFHCSGRTPFTSRRAARRRARQIRGEGGPQYRNRRCPRCHHVHFRPPPRPTGANEVTMTAAGPTPAGVIRPMSWRLAIPAHTKLINANQNLHFRKKAELVKVIRNAAWATARHNGIPALERAHIYFVIHPNTTKRQTDKNKRRDPGNWAPSAKAAVDGLVDAGVLPDDDSTHLIGPDPRIGEPVDGSQLVLWITDLDQISPEHLQLLNPPDIAL